MSPEAAREFLPAEVGRTKAWALFCGATLLLLLLVGWLGGSFLWPGMVRYHVTTENLEVMFGRRLSPRIETLPLARVAEVSVVNLRNGSLRFGTAKPGYCVGYFLFASLGEVFEVGNCGEKGVLVRSSGQATPLLLTPSDPEKFIFAVRNAQPGVFSPPPRSWASLAGWLVLDVLLLLLGGGALYVLFVLAPRRLSYHVRAGELEIRTLGKPVVVGLAGAKVRRHRPLLGERLSGLHLPAYIVGSFMYDQAATRVYASTHEEGVLVEGEGRVFLTPADIDGMLAALGEAGAEVVVSKLQRRL